MNINGVTHTIGADPEVFLKDNNSFCSAYGLLPGTKHDPYKVDKGAIQVDGMAAEFNIDPVDNLEDFQNNLKTVQDILLEMSGGKEFMEDCSVDFTEEFMKEQPYESLMLGCDPDFNAYTLDVNPPPEEGLLMRTAGGHVHMGGFDVKDIYSPQNLSNMARLTKFMDECVGVYSLLWDKNDKRRELYGQAGAYRPKPYGAEYRTLSNSWLFNKKITEFIYNQTEKALQKYYDASCTPNEDCREIINNSDRNSSFFKGNKTAEYVMGVV